MRPPLPRALTAGPASPGRCFLPSCKERKERKEKGLGSELGVSAGELFPCPIFLWQRLHSAADVPFPLCGLHLPPHLARGEGLLWKGHLSPHPWAATSQGQG